MIEGNRYTRWTAELLGQLQRVLGSRHGLIRISRDPQHLGAGKMGADPGIMPGDQKGLGAMFLRIVQIETALDVVEGKLQLAMIVKRGPMGVMGLQEHRPVPLAPRKIEQGGRQRSRGWHVRARGVDPP